MQCLYQNILKEGNGDHKLLRFPDIPYKNFEVMLSAIVLYEVDLEYAEYIISKPTIDNSGFIAYSSTRFFLVNG